MMLSCLQLRLLLFGFRTLTVPGDPAVITAHIFLLQKIIKCIFNKAGFNNLLSDFSSQ